jgi:hypothetical protein
VAVSKVLVGFRNATRVSGISSGKNWLHPVNSKIEISKKFNRREWILKFVIILSGGDWMIKIVYF